MNSYDSMDMNLTDLQDLIRIQSAKPLEFIKYNYQGLWKVIGNVSNDYILSFIFESIEPGITVRVQQGVRVLFDKNRGYYQLITRYLQKAPYDTNCVDRYDKNVSESRDKLSMNCYLKSTKCRRPTNVCIKDAEAHEKMLSKDRNDRRLFRCAKCTVRIGKF